MTDESKRISFKEALEQERETYQRLKQEKEAGLQAEADYWDEVTGEAEIRRLAAELARLRAVLATATTAAEAGQWTACRDALREADHA